MRLAFVSGEEDGEPGAVPRAEVHAVVSVLEVELGQSNGAKAWVGVADEVEDPGECAAKLHGLRRGLRDGRFVDGVPMPGPGVVAEQAGLAVTLILDGAGGKEEVFEFAGDLGDRVQAAAGGARRSRR